MSPDTLKQRLEEKYNDGEIVVTDLTGTQDHYQISIVSNCFEGLSRIQQHKDVMDTFDTELKSGEIHALSIKTQTKPK